MSISAYGRVCLSIIEGGQRRKEIRSFGNETADLLALRAWLLREGCSAVGMESTGVYWMPVYRRLEGFFEIIVANAQHIKAVPGRANRRTGCRLDCRLAPTWFAHGQFRPEPGTTRLARSDPDAHFTGARAGAVGQSHP